jgi:Ca-activated chloride channel family protein
MAQKKDSAAVEQYENASKLETNPLRKAQAFHNIGVVCQSHKMYGEAIEAYKNALRLNPNDDETRYNLVLCKHQKQKQDQNRQNQQGNDDKKEDNKKDQQKPEENKDKKDEQKPQEQQKPQMSKENAEQLLNAAIQNEKQTQDKLKKAQQQPQRRKIEKNW